MLNRMSLGEKNVLSSALNGIFLKKTCHYMFITFLFSRSRIDHNSIDVVTHNAEIRTSNSRMIAP